MLSLAIPGIVGRPNPTQLRFVWPAIINFVNEGDDGTDGFGFPT